MDDTHFLKQAIANSKESVAQGGFPAGTVLVKNGEMVSEGISIGGTLNDPTSHGDIAAIREACKSLTTTDLSGSILYTSMQPCLMCLGASMWSGIRKIVFACPKEKVSAEYYGGHYQPLIINSEFIHPINLVHFAELEKEALAVVREWEKTL